MQLRNTVKFFLCILLVSSACISAPARSKQNGSLRTVIDRYSVQTIRALNKDYGEIYVGYKQHVFHGDVDNDGDLDAVVQLSFCESAHCDPTTETSYIAVFLKSKGGYRFAAGKGFLKFNEDNSTELVGKLKAIKGSKIYVAVYGCEVDDETCLPKYLYSAIYSYKRGGLFRERAYARGR
jgi:hypothetical protein